MLLTYIPIYLKPSKPLLIRSTRTNTNSNSNSNRNSNNNSIVIVIVILLVIVLVGLKTLVCKHWKNILKLESLTRHPHVDRHWKNIPKHGHRHHASHDIMAMVCKHCPPHGQHTWRLSARHGQTTGREWRRVLCKWPVQWQASGAECYAVPHRQLGALRPSQAQAVQASSLVAPLGHLPCASQTAQRRLTRADPLCNTKMMRRIL